MKQVSENFGQNNNEKIKDDTIKIADPEKKLHIEKLRRDQTGGIQIRNFR